MAYYLPLVLVVISYVTYQVSQKLMPQQLNPYAVFVWVYALALVISLVVMFLFERSFTPLKSMSFLNLPVILIALGICGIEFGFLFAYRAHWPISVAPAVASTAGILLLFLIGAIFFKESISIIKVIGCVLAIVGLLLIQLK